MRISICLLTLAMGFIPSAHSQVFKCTGPDGRMVYIDRPCSGKTSGEMLLRERTLEEKLQEREEAYIAEMRKQERRAIEQERELIEQQRREISERRGMMERRYQPQPKTYAQELAERNARVRSVFEDDPKTSLYRSRGGSEAAHTTTKPRNHSNDDNSSHTKITPGITHCQGKRCYDTDGQSHLMHNNGTTFNGPGGAFCKRKGDSANCF